MTQQAAMTPFIPQFMEQMEKTAEWLSKSLLIPPHLRGKVYDVFATILTGHEYGFTPMQAIREIYLVDGKPSFSATMIVAMCLRKPEVCEYFKPIDAESNEAKATYETKRSGHDKPTRLVFTIEQAQKANLAGKDNWKKYPAAMLQRRCATFLARAVYPDLILGAIEKDEAEEIEINKPPLRVAPPPAESAQPAALSTPPVKTEIRDPVAAATAAMPIEVHLKKEPGAEQAQPPAAQPTPERARTMDAFEQLFALIEEATTIAGLEALVPDLQKLPKEEQRAIKPDYDKKRAALANGGAA